MAKDLNRSIKIYIDNSDAMKKTDSLKEKIGKLQSELQDLAATGKKDTAEYAKKEKALQQLQGAYQRYIDKVIETEHVLKNLSGATKKQLETVRNQLRKELKETARGTDEYKAKLQALIAVEKELAKVSGEMKSEIGSKASMWSRAADGFNKYFGLVTSFIAAITGVSFTLRKLAEDNAKLDDVYSDVMKTTDMTRDKVVDLNVEFKKMDTRTAREELNNLARDAGKLGRSGKKDIMDFVEAGNQINVSLGEDLGEGAIKSIGKLTDVFLLSTKEMDRMDLKGRMLAIGSAINELGASSTASEGYMVNFTQRLGGVAAQAGISIQDVLGYASALDQSGQAVEMSATALQKFIMTLMGEPAKFAKIAGLEVKAFNKLIKEDTNAAIKEVLSALSQKGGFQQLIPIFKEMGLDGARAVGVLSALATNIDKVNVAQKISNKAFSDGTSISNEYNIKNNNLQATLEKQRKAFNDAALELGERLNPVLLKSTNLTTHFIKLLPSVLDFLEKYGKTIIAVGTAIGVYMGVVKLVTLSQANWTIVDTIHYRLLQAKSVFLATYRSALLLLNVVINLITGNTLRAAAAWRMLGASMQANVIGIVITAVIALGYAIYELNKKMKDQFTAAKALNDINKEVAQSIAAEKSELDLLLSVARNEKISKEERLKAIKRLNEISPEYLGNLNLENINTQEATKSIEAYSAALLKNARAKAIQGNVEKQYARKDEIDAEIQDINSKKGPRTDYILGEYITSTYGDKDFQTYEEKERIKELNKEKELVDKKIEIYTSFYEKTLEADKKGLVNELQTNRSYLEEFEKQHADTYSRIQENKKKAFYSSADEAKDRVELNMLSKKLEAQRKLVQEQESDYAERVKPKKDDLTPPPPPDDKGSKGASKQEKALKEVDTWLKQERTIRKQAYLDNLLDKNAFDKEMESLEMESLRKKLAIAGLEPAKIAEIEEAILDFKMKLREQELKDIEEKNRKKQELAKWNEDETKAIVEASLKDIDEQSEKKVLALMDERANNLISEQIYQDQLLEIERTALEEKLRINGLTEEQIGNIRKKQLEDQIQNNNKAQNKSMEMARAYIDLGQNFASGLADILMSSMQNTEESTADFQYNMLMLALDTLRQIVLLATAEAIAKEIGSKGIFGIATGAVAAAAINLAFAGVKGMIKRPSTGGDSSSSTTGSGSSGQITVKQQATGKYDVIGEQDGQLYKDVPFAGVAQTGMVYKPTLVGESGAELVVSSPDMKALQKHINYPLIVQAINDARNGRVPQRADGKYDTLNNTNAIIQQDPVQAELLDLLRDLKENGLESKTYFGVTEYQARLDHINKNDSRFTRKEV